MSPNSRVSRQISPSQKLGSSPLEIIRSKSVRYVFKLNSKTPPRLGPPKSIVSYEVHFSTSLDRLGDMDKRILDDVAARMKATAAAEALIIGHTDSSENTGPYADLDRRRADVVRDYLVLQGIDLSRIKTEGRSIREPVGDDSTVAGRGLNRRAEIKLLTRE